MNLLSTKADVIAQACTALESNGTEAASALIGREYPFNPQLRYTRQYSTLEKMSIFVRDGFIDRYTGERLVIPGALRVISLLCPKEFPYHKNGKTDCCHFAMWELFPSIDHVIPVTRGGTDDQSNWVTTSMLRNSAKQLWTLEELGWQLHPPGNFANWDGLTTWFCRFMESNQHSLLNRELPYLRSWYQAAKKTVPPTNSVNK